MQMWRNWQTRYFEVVVRFLVWVQVPSSAPYADMAELADALDSGSSDFTVIQVQVLLSAPNSINPNLFLIGNGFGFLIFYRIVTIPIQIGGSNAFLSRQSRWWAT